jgi:hypothetical protein
MATDAGQDALKALTDAADAVGASPLPLTDEAAKQFLEEHPLDEIFRSVGPCGPRARHEMGASHAAPPPRPAGC